MTGVVWEYPEFKGVFDRVDWMRLDLRSGLTLVLDTAPGSQVGILRPGNKEILPGQTDDNHGPVMAVWDYPAEGGLFFFHKVPAVGTKFRKPSELGPQSQPEVLSEPIRGRVVFHAR